MNAPPRTVVKWQNATDEGGVKERCLHLWNAAHNSVVFLNPELWRRKTETEIKLDCHHKFTTHLPTSGMRGVYEQTD